MEFYGWIALFVLAAIIIRAVVKKSLEKNEEDDPDAAEKPSESPAEKVSDPPTEPPKSAAPAPQSPLDMPIDKYLVYLLLGGVAICAGLWIYGCADAASDVQNGLNMLTYRMKLSNMNLISRQGYKYYIENNTDMPQREREVQQKMEKLDKEMEKLDKLFNP